MAESTICQRCGVMFGADGAQGLCPACLLQQGLYDSQPATLPSGAATTPSADLAELVRLFPQLEIIELVGRGGMGVVYKARHRGLDRLAALKILPPDVDRDPGFQERFVREARALARLNHPNIVSLYDFGQVEGRYYFLMEFVDGANLRKMLQAGHLTPLQAMAIVPQLCDALQFAHEEGIVHRDIKPENILLDRKGRVKIADFGLAKLVSGSMPRDPYTLTSARQVLGTPHYMAPEQFERPGTVDHRADIYSLGVVFYEMLTGELPLGRFPPPSRKVEIDVRLDQVVLRTLEKEPEHRYQRAGEVKTELASLTTAAPPGPPRWSAGDVGSPGPREPAPAGQPSLSPWAIAGLLAALAFPAAGLAASIGVALQDGPPPPGADFIVMLIAALGVTCAVSSCALGLAGIRQIRASGGRYYGLKLALADALAYPLLLFDLIFLFVTMFLVDPRGGEPDRIVVLVCAVALGLDVWIVRRMWRRVSRAPDPRPVPPEPFRRPPRPAPPSSRAYSLPPKSRLAGVLTVLGIVFVVLLVVITLFLLVYARHERAAAVSVRDAAIRERDVAMSIGQAVIRPNGNAQVGSGGGAHDFSFEIHSPVDAKTTVWAEVWKDGKLQMAPGFDTTQWVIPPPGQAFEGSARFSTEPEADGKIMAGWRIEGNAGSIISEEAIPDPFAGMTLRDSTWGRWTDSWTVSPGQPLQLLALRGSKNQLMGSPDDNKLKGRAQAELRLFARFDPLTAKEQHSSRPMIGSSPHPPTRGGGNMPAGDRFKTPPALPPPPVIPQAGTDTPSTLPPQTFIPPAGTDAPSTPSVGSSPAGVDAPSALPPPTVTPPAGTDAPSTSPPSIGISPAGTDASSAAPPASGLPAAEPPVRPPASGEAGSPGSDSVIGGRH